MARMNIVLSCNALYPSEETGLQLWNGELETRIKWSGMVLTIIQSTAWVQHTSSVSMLLKTWSEQITRAQPSLFSAWDQQIRTPLMFQVTNIHGRFRYQTCLNDRQTEVSFLMVNVDLIETFFRFCYQVRHFYLQFSNTGKQIILYHCHKNTEGKTYLYVTDDVAWCVEVWPTCLTRPNKIWISPHYS